MARELVIEVSVEGAEQATSKLAAVDRAVDGVESSAKRAAPSIDKLSAAHYEQSDAAKRAAQDMATLSTVIQTYAGPALIVSAAKKTLDFADRVQSLSQNVKVSAETLQKWGHVADKNGSTMEAVANAAQRLGANLARGGKTVTSAMDELGLSVEKLASLNPEERFRAVATAIGKIEDPARQARLAQVLLSQSGQALISTMEDIAKGLDKHAPAMSNTWVKANADVKNSLDDLLASAMNIGRWMLAWAPVLVQKAGEIGDAWHQKVLARVYGVSGGVAPLPIPAAPGGVFQLPTPFQAPGLPFGGNTRGIEDQLTAGAAASIAAQRRAGGGAAGRGRVLPFRQSTFFGGSAAAAAFGMANTPGTFSAGRFPFTSSMNMPPLDAAFQQFGGVGFAPTVGMNRPGSGGGGLGGWLSGHKTQVAGLGLGLMSRFIPQGGRLGAAASMASQGASMGAMFGPWGMGIGAAAGGLMGLFTGGKAKKNARSAETMEVFQQFSSKEFIDLQKQADKFGISMNKALTAKTMKDFGLAVDEVNAKLKTMTDLQDEIDSLTARSKVGFDEMNAVVQEFGLDISKLGPAFQQAALDKEAQRIIDAFAIMEKGGADINGVLDGMADEISTVVQDSIRFGTVIPENMKPWIEKLAASGKLLDENGQAITDTSNLKFGAPLVSEMDKVVKKLDELIAKLAEVAAGFGNAAGAAGGLGGVDYNTPSNPSGNREGDPSGFAVGGVAGRDFRRPGYGDVFPALLKRGERVMPAGSSGGVSLTIGNMTVGGGYGSRADAVEDIGTAVVAYMERRGARLVA